MKTEMLQWKETKVMRDIKGDKMFVVSNVIKFHIFSK